jgi:aspartyl-tRNA(Asn)/glutamyl-tRNA(Gln) amidotransferase subunit A
MIDLKNLTIKKAHEDLISGKYSSVDLAESYLEVIKKKNDDLSVYLEIFRDVIEQAKKADDKISNGEASILTGIPIAVKDNILIKGRNVSAASKILEDYTAVYDATVIEKLKKVGAVFLGRVNMDEFAMGSSTENSAFGVTKNPNDTTRVSGGSSGGSAAAVAANMALVSLGSDTGGSIRQPASFCGVVGFKPTYGNVSRYGLMALGSSLDQIGTFGKTVEDAEILFNAIRGYDSKDSTSISMENIESVEVEPPQIGKGIVVGVPDDFIEMDGVDKKVIENFKSSLDKLEKDGYEIKKIKLPNLKYSLASYYIVMPAEASTNLARFDSVRYGLHREGDGLLDDYIKTRGTGFGKEVRRRIILGTYVLSAGYYDAYYNKATAVRKLIKKDFDEAFKDVDMIVTPTTPTPAFKIGEKSNDPLQMYLADIFTVPVNLAGIPAMSIPSGFINVGDKDLPLGFQLIAPSFKEDRLFKTAVNIERLLQ